MRWTPHQRSKARERFWNPVREQAHAILQHCDGYLDLDYIQDAIDPAIFGKRGNSPVFMNALIMVLRAESSLYIADVA